VVRISITPPVAACDQLTKLAISLWLFQLELADARAVSSVLPLSLIGGIMKSKIISKEPTTYALIFETGEEVADGLKTFAQKEGLAAASFKAIGAFSKVELAWFDWESKAYKPSVVLSEQLELLSLIGDIALDKGKPAVHAHAVVGRKDGSAHGGHLLKAFVRPTCEVIITESPEHLKKQVDPESGLALIRP
jgi:hypothetical protein